MRTKVLLFAVLMLFIFCTKGEAQTITPRIAERIGLFCYSHPSPYIRNVCYACLSKEYGIYRTQDLEKAYLSMANNRKMAQDIIFYLYRFYNGNDDWFYGALKNVFTIDEIEIMENLSRQKLEQEQRAERKRDEAEAEKRRIEEEEEAKRRQNHIDEFLAEREQKIYELDTTQIQYKTNEKLIYIEIGKIMDKNGIKNLSFTLTDSCIIDYNGNSNHAVQIQGISNRVLAREIKQAVGRINFAAMSAKEPYTQENYPVTSESKYVIPYDVLTKTENLTLLRKKDGLTLIKGNELFFNNVQGNISNDLNRNGKYRVEVTDFQNGNIKDVETSILNYKKANRFFIGMGLSNLSGTIGTKYTLGIADINYSSFGLYISFAGYSDPNLGDFFGGVVLSASNSIAFYGGVGSVSENVHNHNDQTQPIVIQSNFATELGIMLKIKYFFISSDCDYVINNDYRFSIGCGIIF